MMKLKRFFKDFSDFLSKDDTFDEPVEIEFSQSMSLVMVDILHELKTLNAEINKIVVELTYLNDRYEK